MLTKEQKNLLRHSEAIKDHKFLKEIVDKDLAYTDNDLKQYAPEVLKEIKVRKRVVQAAELEWKGNPIPSYIEDDYAVCQLCGNNRNKKVYIITNTLNGNQLNIGSSCIDKFSELKKISKDGTARSKKATDKIKRVQIVIERFGDLEENIRDWEKPLLALPIVLPSNIEDRYIQIGNEIKDLYNKYINGSIDAGRLAVIQLKLSEAEAELAKIQKYAESHKNDPLAIPIAIGKWLKNNRFVRVLSEIKKQGITPNLAVSIQEPGFMNRIAERVNSEKNLACRPADIGIRGGYILQIKQHPSVKLQVLHADLVRALGNTIYEGEINIENILYYCKPNDVNSQLEIASLSKRVIGDMRLYQINPDTDQIILQKDTEDAYVIMGLIEYLDIVKIPTLLNRSDNLRPTLLEGRITYTKNNLGK